jgi:ParB/RepB/Spo0J family partition protein
VSRDTLLSLIDPDPEQPRKHVDEVSLQELAQSMAAHGLAVPVLLRPTADGRYILVHGERRWRAAHILGWESIAAEVRELSPEEAHWLSLIENIQRDDLSPIEEAQAYEGHLRQGLTQDALAQRIGKERSYIAQKLRLLTCPAGLQCYLHRKALSEGHARQLLRIRGMYGETYPQAWDFETEIPTITCDTLFGLMAGIRPSDHPAPFRILLRAPAAPVLPVLLKASTTFVQGWVQAGAIPAWEIAAFWWGTAAVWIPLSVADLARHITMWWEHLESAIAMVQLRGWDGDADLPDAYTPESLGWYEYWGYRSDLRHAMLLDAVIERRLPPEMRKKAVRSVVERGYAYPTECQPWGDHGQRYRELVNAEQERMERARE